MKNRLCTSDVHIPIFAQNKKNMISSFFFFFYHANRNITMMMAIEQKRLNIHTIQTGAIYNPIFNFCI